MKHIPSTILLALLFAVSASGQFGSADRVRQKGPTVPTSCVEGQLFLRTGATDPGLYVCAGNVFLRQMAIDADGNIEVGAALVTGCSGVDDTQLIQTALDTYGDILLSSEICTVSNIVPTKDITIAGLGPRSILLFKTGSTGWMIDGSTYGVRLSNIILDGGLTSTQVNTVSAGSRSGVQFNATVRGSGLYSSSVRGFNNVGIGLTGDANHRWQAPGLFACGVYWNYVGVETRVGASGTAGEYSRIIGCSISENRNGMILYAGNTQVVGNVITDNYNNIQILSDSNGGKSIITGNSINHASNYAVYAGGPSGGVGNGYVITGNQSQLGMWYFNNVSGFVVTNNEINSTFVTLQGAGGSGNVFASNYMPTNARALFDTGWTISDNSLAGGGNWLGYFRATSLGPNLFSAGDFASTGGWTIGSGWSISANTAVCDGTSGSASYLYHDMDSAPVNGTTYAISFTISGSAGSGTMAFGIGGNDITAAITPVNGRQTIYLPVINKVNNALIVVSSVSAYTISNVTVQAK